MPFSPVAVLVTELSNIAVNDFDEQKSSRCSRVLVVTELVSVTLCTVRKPFSSFSGQKYEFAKKWAIKIVRPQWLYDSVEKGHCCDAVKYKVEESGGSGEGEGQRTSTPNRGSEGLCEYKKVS